MTGPSKMARVAAFSAVLALALAASAAASPATPSPGSPGIGDVLFPTLGNGGYDAEHYALAVRYPTGVPGETVQGRVTMYARATQPLSRFDLDFSGDSVGSVSVDGRRAGWTWSGGEIVITPAEALRDHKKFTVRVTYTAHAFTPATDDPFPFGFFTVNRGSVTAGQPNVSNTFYPVNDHPADKASYNVSFDVPAGTTAVSNGTLESIRTTGGRTYSTYVMREPLASELIQLAVGDFDVTDRGSVDHVHVRDVSSHSATAAIEPALARTPDQLRWMIDQVGRYPFGEYGVLAADQAFFYALETQTLSLHPAFLFAPGVPGAAYEPIMVHELAHQWFGDSVAPIRWQDVWLNEGHADYYQQLYAEQLFFGPGYTLDYWRDAYRRANQLRHDFGPVAKPTGNDIFTLFSDNVYSGGSLALYALRQVIGEEQFAKVERSWVKHYKGESVGTEQWIAHVNHVTHRNLTAFLRDWLYANVVPPMPGHPDWTADPVTAAATARSEAATPTSARALELGLHKR